MITPVAESVARSPESPTPRFGSEFAWSQHSQSRQRAPTSASRLPPRTETSPRSTLRQTLRPTILTPLMTTSSQPDALAYDPGTGA